ncbi:MAG: hypothetical protein KDD94_09530 [Calditrichaeota bacterium]|nr:hypothetical protein [Calditrichota bacterium]
MKRSIFFLLLLFACQSDSNSSDTGTGSFARISVLKPNPIHINDTLTITVTESTFQAFTSLNEIRISINSKALVPLAFYGFYSIDSVQVRGSLGPFNYAGIDTAIVQQYFQTILSDSLINSGLITININGRIIVSDDSLMVE